LYAVECGASKIFAFEPELLNYKCLVENKPANCIALKAAVGGTTRMCNLHLATDSCCHSLYTGNGERELVPCLSLKDLFDRHVFDHIDFLKVDVEGAEVEVFESLPDSYLHKIHKGAIEWHHRLNSKCQNFMGRMSFAFDVFRMDDVKGHVGYVYFTHK